MCEAYIITPVQPADAAGLAYVNFTAWQQTYRGILDDVYMDTLSIEKFTARWHTIIQHQRSNTFVFVLRHNEKIIGYCSGGPVLESAENYPAQVYSLYLLKEHHGHKQGHALFKKAALQLQQLGFTSFCVFVLQQNPALQFYKQHQPVFEKLTTVEIGNKTYPEILLGWNSYSYFE